MNTTQDEIQQRSQARVTRRATIDAMKLNTFGKRLMLARKDIGLTQEELIDALARYNVSIGQTYVSALETTDKMPVGQVVAAMAKVLGVSADYLLLLTDDPLPQGAPHDDHEVGISPEAERIARVVDTLTQRRRAEAERLVNVIAESAAASATLVETAANDVATRIQTLAPLSDAAVEQIRLLLLDYATEVAGLPQRVKSVTVSRKVGGNDGQNRRKQSVK